MSADLHTLIRQAGDAAVGDQPPAPVDTAQLWQRGRRRRAARRTAPVLAVLAVVGIGTAAVATAYGSDLLRPLTTEDSAPLAPEGRFTPLAPGEVHDLRDLPGIDLAEHASQILRLPEPGPHGPSLFDVAADGTVAWTDPERGIVLQHPDEERATVIGMPEPFLQLDGQWIVHTLQWGPDDRLYVTGQDPEAEDARVGLSQVLVLERGGEVVGVRDNDAGQFSRLLFADGFAWHPQRTDQDGPAADQRWQAVAELGGRLLPMPEQRDTDVSRRTAPDGLRLDLDWRDTHEGRDAGSVLTSQTGRELRSFGVVTGRGWLSVDDPLRDGFRLATAGLYAEPNLVEELTGNRRSVGSGLVLFGPDGTAHALRIHQLDDEEHSTIEDRLVLGRDGHLYLVQPRDAGAALLRYEHPVPGAADPG